MSQTLVLWQLDDACHWHDISANSLQHWNNQRQSSQHWLFRGFTHSRDLIYGLDECLDSELWPQIILMDYYLIDERGDQVTAALRSYLSKLNEAPHITIIGHSSVRSCSQHICKAGADLAVIKRETAGGLNKHLLQYLDVYCQ
ncbi:MAG: hypothetical protein HRU15_00730 [Planctomycetes bacterium]|nr:hypothetical protein [Planctomycetota bacterium]